MGTGKPSSSRLAFLDWMRGAAAVMMLNGHVFDSFARTADREAPAFRLTQFIGGMPPAIFLFLVGVTLAFLMESRERQGVPSGQRHADRDAAAMGLAQLARAGSVEDAVRLGVDLYVTGEVSEHTVHLARVGTQLLVGPRIVASVRQGVAAGVAEHVDVDWKGKLARFPIRFTRRFTASAVNGPPRSVWNTKAPSAFRCKSRSMRNSSPRIG